MNPFVEAQFYIQGVDAMIKSEKYCKTCGHKCHCNETECKKCANDICYNCKCDDNIVDIPSSFVRNNV